MVNVNELPAGCLWSKRLMMTTIKAVTRKLKL